MAAKKPLVIGTDGFPEELSSSDTLDANTGGKDIVTLANANAGSIVIGAPVYKTATSNQVDLARANASGTRRVIGLVADASIAAGASGSIQTDGVLVATTGEWDAVTGGSGGLTPGSQYWLSAATAGQLTTSVPGSGNYVVPVGIALSTTELEISIGPGIKKA
jgi:hypothetical protein